MLLWPERSRDTSLSDGEDASCRSGGRERWRERGQHDNATTEEEQQVGFLQPPRRRRERWPGAQGGLLVSALALGASCEHVAASACRESLPSAAAAAAAAAGRTRGLWLWYFRRYVSVMQLSTLKYVVRDTSSALHPDARSSLSQEDGVLLSGSEPDLELASEKVLRGGTSGFRWGLK